MPSSDREDAIAIIGMACRVAGANSPSELWHLLATSKDVQSEITRFNTEGFYHPDGGPRKGLTNVTRAYMMPDDAIDRFDNAFFQTTLMEAVAMDPQQRMLLEICYEAVESAGIPLDKFSGTDTAVYAGKGRPLPTGSIRENSTLDQILRLNFHNSTAKACEPGNCILTLLCRYG